MASAIPVIIEGVLYQSSGHAARELGMNNQAVWRRCKDDIRWENWIFTEYVIPEEKECHSCGETKLLSSFYNHPTTRDGKMGECKRCSSKRLQKWNINNKEYRKNRDLIYAYGITLDNYNKLFEEQKGCCNICGRHQSILDRALSVDHDHETGKVRGLLCKMCNIGIGNLGDDPKLLLKAIEYLEKYK